MHILKSQLFNDSELLTYASSLSQKSGDLTEKILHWEFGPIMTMAFDQDAKNYLFSQEKVPLHWDGAFHREPSKLLFYCLESEGNGGETIFTDTSKIWCSLTSKEKELCSKVTLIYRTEKLAHYGGMIKVPLVQQHPFTGETILRLAEKVETGLNPVTLEVNGIAYADEFYQMMVEKLYHHDFLYEHHWEKGDLLVCDNFTYLHGRRSLQNNLKRSFKRIQIL